MKKISYELVDLRVFYSRRLRFNGCFFFVRMLRSLRFAAVQSRQVGTAARSFATVRPFKVLGVQQIAVGGLDKVSKECNMIHST